MFDNLEQVSFFQPCIQTFRFLLTNCYESKISGLLSSVRLIDIS